jgi:hypothetical protein
VTIVNVNADKDCGKDCGSNGGGSGGDNGSVKPSDNGGGGGSGGDNGSVKPSDNGGGGGGQGQDTRDCGPGQFEVSRTAESLACSSFVPPNPQNQACPEGTSESISNGERSCIPQGPGENQACPEGTVLTQDLGCKPAKDTNAKPYLFNGTTDVLNNGTLSIKKIVSTTKKFIPDATYLISPNPYTLHNSLRIHDNDNNDFNNTQGVLVLNNISYSSYLIQEIIPRQTRDYILHETRISVNEWLPHPVLDIVEDKNLGKPLPGTTTIPFQYIIALKDNVIEDPQSVAEKFVIKGAELLHVYRYSMKGFALHIPNLKLLDEIAIDPKIASIEQDSLGQIASIAVLPDYLQTIPTGVSRVVESIGINSSYTRNQSQSLNDSQLHNKGRDFVNVDVAIVDTGISKSHPELNVYRDVTFVNDTTTADDDNGHGSHVAGTVAAKDNSFGVIGVAPGARLWAIKVCDEQLMLSGLAGCPVSNQIKALDFVIQHADEIDVANISIDNNLHKYSFLDKAVSKAIAAGVTVVASAGNKHEDVRFTSPAHNPDVISVSAIADSDGKCGGLGRSTMAGADDTLANFSNFGHSVTIASPGVDILSTYNGEEYALESGTSMAAPHVTGAAALYKSYHPRATPSEVKYALLHAASLPTTLCDGKSHGYFSGDVDNFKEPLLYTDKQQPAGEQNGPVQSSSGFVANINKQQRAGGGEQARPIQPQSGFVANDNSRSTSNNSTAEHTK